MRSNSTKCSLYKSDLLKPKNGQENSADTSLKIDIQGDFSFQRIF
ncbi:hypothetical protein LEP1GSC045_2439 [Leptospira interrogans serovar Pomona str. Kennewicki LC82-25]|nr:hypothetical protein LEP1GSC045_2439 [Leptospira interrogans serovar Pomona str. Kennewicki LC82-25]EJP15280.1 hypothetical protein LEP1GSC080_3755 [Leptospira interrogans str. FPW2026]EKN99020.1 hypothetical protein LEP1GSC014_2938 [Leptospira interrogans serovar Pomona str. Pomona]EMI63264.1 hypothetical protein LEP1GSC200_1358 [Leptospira interrogans serovar Pomona str. CSL10083]EMJ60580.1 hypothetical protein LEP1GSC197_1953 [Leptospira interrogans serovar Pomona str. CSL4002]